MIPKLSGKRIMTVLAVMVCTVVFFAFKDVFVSRAQPFNTRTVSQNSKEPDLHPSVKIAGKINLSENTGTIRQAQSGPSLINLQRGRGLRTDNLAAGLAAQEIDPAQAQPTTMATDDLNGDAFPDLICGYATPNGGFLLIYYGDEAAFAPNGGKNPENLIQNRFPVPFGEMVAIRLDEAPDFILTGDFDRDSRKDIRTARRHGNSLNLQANQRGGNFTSKRLDLPGKLRL